MGATDWRMAIMRPGRDPFHNLSKELLQESCLGFKYGNFQDNQDLLRATLERGPRGLLEVY